MKALIIANALQMGGIENMLLKSIPFYKKHGIEVEILCNLGGELDDAFKKKNIKLIDFEFKGSPLHEAFSLYKILKTNKYDLVHSQYNHTSGFFAILTVFFGIPFYLSVHNQKPLFKLIWQSKVHTNLVRILYLKFHKLLTIQFSKKIIGHSKANLIYYSRDWQKYTEKYTVVNNGIDFSSLNNIVLLEKAKQIELDSFIDNAEKVFIHIGKFKDQKNHKFLINVFEKLKPIKNKYKLLLLGIGENKKKIEKIVKQKKIEKNILFVGLHDNIGAYLVKSDVFLFPSLYEGFGNVLIEAQYCNLPIIASDIDPHYESVYKLYWTLFFDPNDESEFLKKFDLFLKNQDIGLYESVKKEAKTFASLYSIENMIDQIAAIYQKDLFYEK